MLAHHYCVFLLALVYSRCPVCLLVIGEVTPYPPLKCLRVKHVHFFLSA